MVQQKPKHLGFERIRRCQVRVAALRRQHEPAPAVANDEAHAETGARPQCGLRAGRLDFGSDRFQRRRGQHGQRVPHRREIVDDERAIASQHCAQIARVAADASVRQFAASVDHGTRDRKATPGQIVAADVLPIAFDQSRAVVEVAARIIAHLAERERRVGERETRVSSADVADENTFVHFGKIRSACNCVN